MWQEEASAACTEEGPHAREGEITFPLLQCLLIRGSHLLNYAARSPLALQWGHPFHSLKGDWAKDSRAFSGTGPRAQVSPARALSGAELCAFTALMRCEVVFSFLSQQRPPALSTGAEAGTGFLQIDP